MINSKFLRRIEPNPSKDLAYRTDLYEYQLTKPLEWTEWSPLCSPTPTPEFIEWFDWALRDLLAIKDWKVIEDWLQTNTVYYTFYNREIVWLCLLNRVRQSQRLPLIEFQEYEWTKYLKYWTNKNFVKEWRQMWISKI